jgi:phytol kinase
MNPWLGILSVLGSLTGLLVICQYLGKSLDLSPELGRKAVHMGMGLICTCFPLLFRETWPVFFLAGIAVISLLAVRMLPALRNSIGSSLHSVKRSSFGEIYFPLSVSVVWFVSIDQPLFFSLSILVLTLADAIAALIGTQYGRQLYSTKEGFKTWEGSFFFFTITFLCIHIPLLLMTDIGRAESLLLAMLIGILVMIIEAVAWRGLDNLFIPISVCIFLNIYVDYSAQQMLSRIGGIVLVILLLFFVRSRAKLDDASLLGASLITYSVFNIGGWQWVFAPIVVFINYLLLEKKKTNIEDRVHNIHALLAVTVPGFLWLMLYYRHPNGFYILAHNLAYMAELICILMAQWAFKYPQKTLLKISCESTILGFSIIMLPYILLNLESFSWKILLATLFTAFFSSQSFRFFQPQMRDCPLTSERFIRQGLICLLASVIPRVFIS